MSLVDVFIQPGACLGVVWGGRPPKISWSSVAPKIYVKGKKWNELIKVQQETSYLWKLVWASSGYLMVP